MTDVTQDRFVHVRRGPTQTQVAAGMGLTGKGGWNVIARLVRGDVKRPDLLTAAQHPKACGVRPSEFFAVFDAIDYVPVDTSLIDWPQSPRQRTSKARNLMKPQVNAD